MHLFLSFKIIGGNPVDLGSLDGYNMWETLSNNAPSPRTEVLLNIDPINKVSALRVGNFKIIQGTAYNGQWDGWYGPSGRENFTHTEMFKKKFSKQPGFNSELLCNQLPAMLEKKNTSCFPAKSPCLFDVTADPCELNNLADEKPEVSLLLLLYIMLLKGENVDLTYFKLSLLFCSIVAFFLFKLF